MQFLVLGVDGPAFDGALETDLHEQHQSYMDGWADVLVARGPTLTADGETHTGSLHVVDLPDLKTATRFAREEPYARAGWYTEVAVYLLDPCVGGTMWDRARPARGRPSSFVRATFEARTPAENRPRADSAPPWLYLGLVLTDDTRATTGIVGLVDLAPTEAERRMSDAAAALGLAPLDVSAQRWQRGGRRQT